MPLFFKALERLVQWCMDATALPLDKEQHAFRKGHCTEGALSQLVDTVERALHHRQKALVVYLDIKGPFDNLNSSTIAQGMVEHGVEEEDVHWFEGYLQSRYCSVKGSNQHYKLVKGTGQGGVLSPIVWKFVMDSFLAAYSDHAATAISYADNRALIITCTDLEIART
jgi:retron-type reverse transcriptase